MRRSALLCLLLVSGLTACYREDTRELFFQIPDATTPQELEALRDLLLRDHQLLPETVRYYHDITAQTDPPGLRIRFEPRHLAARNIESKLNALGYRVNDLPGDPERLRQHRATLQR